ncbi:MAG: phytanoyl-CoA dioxygenase family protein [Candidatus Latescibacteria bacterium]|nr:phytanoyl-CoA dioxygenase family protein [Candidatus Latescibacterota bacterium]
MSTDCLIIDGINIDELITNEVIEEYWDRGYWTSPKLFDDGQVSRLRQAHQRLWDGDLDSEILSQYGKRQYEPDSPDVRQQCNAFWVSNGIRKVTTSRLLGAIGARFMGVDTVRLWHDQAVYKPGIGPDGKDETAGNIGWHQDYGHWRASSTSNMCTAWVALQDTDLQNGGMRTIVGSHKWGLLEESATFGHKDLDGLRQRFAKDISGEWIDEPCILKAGQVSFHQALTLHGSGPNLSLEPRLCVISHMMPGNTTYVPGHGHPNLVFLGPNARAGQPFSGAYWPVMWPAE